MSTLQQLIHEIAGQNDVQVRNYSGRGMFGRYCMSISGDIGYCMQVISAVIVEAHNMIIDKVDNFQNLGNFDQLVDTLLSFEQDSMGRGAVLYWRDLEYSDDNDEEFEEE